MKHVPLAENIYWVGKIDNREVPFHRLTLAKGTTYNAYLLSTEKPTVIDTIDMQFGREFVEYLSELIDRMRFNIHCYQSYRTGSFRWNGSISQ